MKREVKLWHTITGLFLTIIVRNLNQRFMTKITTLELILDEIMPFILLFWTVMFFYVMIRNIFRAIKGIPKGNDYRNEAQRACEKVTPKRKQDATPPWEE